MKAWQVSDLGESKKVHQFVDVAHPEPCPDRLVVRVLASPAPLVNERFVLAEVASAVQRLADGLTIGRVDCEDGRHE